MSGSTFTATSGRVWRCDPAGWVRECDGLWGRSGALEAWDAANPPESAARTTPNEPPSVDWEAEYKKASVAAHAEMRALEAENQGLTADIERAEGGRRKAEVRLGDTRASLRAADTALKSWMARANKAEAALAATPKAVPPRGCVTGRLTPERAHADARDAGARAFKEGRSIEENPHQGRRSQSEYAGWDAGWTDAETEWIESAPKSVLAALGRVNAHWAARYHTLEAESAATIEGLAKQVDEARGYLQRLANWSGIAHVSLEALYRLAAERRTHSEPAVSVEASDLKRRQIEGALKALGYQEGVREVLAALGRTLPPGTVGRATLEASGGSDDR